ncbi:UNVERIFIED_CONTAM: hypothetical protein FKN15_010242 [Acipenser sinensis]
MYHPELQCVRESHNHSSTALCDLPRGKQLKSTLLLQANMSGLESVVIDFFLP